MKKFLIHFGFTCCPVEESLFIYKDNNVKFLLILYVDDILYFAKDQMILERFEQELKGEFAVKLKRQLRNSLEWRSIKQTPTLKSLNVSTSKS